MKRTILITLTLCLTTHLFSQSDSAFFTIEELQAIRKQQIRLKYCDSSKALLLKKDSVCEESIVKLNQVIKNQKQELNLTDSYNQTLKINLLESEKKIKRLERRQRLFRTGFIITTGTTAGLLLLILAQ